MDSQPLLSIVITSYTTERIDDVFELLDSIKDQSYPHIETIFVAEQSRDLYNKVKAYIKGKEIRNTKIIYNDGEPGASHARNMGIGQATGTIIAFIDDDAIPFSNWAEEMVKTYTDESVIGVTGPAFPLWKDEYMMWIPKEFFFLISCTSWCEWNETIEVRNVWTENASFKKEAFDIAGFFATEIGPKGGSMEGRKREISEDVELSLRIRGKTKKRIMLNPNVKIWHKVYKYRLTFKNIIKWSYWLGFSKYKLKTIYQHEDFGGTDVLYSEHQLLKRIFSTLLPYTFKEFFKRPGISLRKLSLSAIILSFVGLGYLSSFLLSRLNE